MTEEKILHSQLLTNSDMSSGNVHHTKPMMYNVTLPSYNSSSIGPVDNLKINERPGSHDHSIRSEMSSKISGSDFMPQSISHSEGSVYQVKIDRGDSPNTEGFDFKVNARDLLLLRMSWDILLREYLTPEELKVFQALLLKD